MKMPTLYTVAFRATYAEMQRIVPVLTRNGVALLEMRRLPPEWWELLIERKPGQPRIRAIHAGCQGGMTNRQPAAVTAILAGGALRGRSATDLRSRTVSEPPSVWVSVRDRAEVSRG